MSRRERTARRLSLTAQELTDERGFDGWTMDELAEAADVSRRTLFNYFPAKVDAVIGPPLGLSAESRERFLARGAGSNLIDGLRLLAADLLEVHEIGPEDIRRSRRILLANPRLLTIAHERFEGLSAGIVELIRAREGAAYDAGQALVAIRLVCALFDASLDAFIQDPADRTLLSSFDETVEIARSLLT